jgi:Glycosyl transferase family group 2
MDALNLPKTSCLFCSTVIIYIVGIILVELMQAVPKPTVSFIPHNLIKIPILLFGALFIPIVAEFFMGCQLLNSKRQGIIQLDNPKQANVKFYLRITTRGLCPNLIFQSLEHHRDVFRQFNLSDSEIIVVTENLIAGVPNSLCRQLLVPTAYQTKNGSLFKQRNICYFWEKMKNEIADDNWVVDLDEDTLITNHAFQCLLHACQRKLYDIVHFPRVYGHGDHIDNFWTTMADSVMCAIDFNLRLCFSYFGLKYPCLQGGSFASVAVAEKTIGFDKGKHLSICEDLTFATCAQEQQYRIGYILSPFHDCSPPTVVSLIKQRGRWICAFLNLFYYLKPTSSPVSLVGLSLICWALYPMFALFIIGGALLIKFSLTLKAITSFYIFFFAIFHWYGMLFNFKIRCSALKVFFGLVYILVIEFSSRAYGFYQFYLMTRNQGPPKFSPTRSEIK